MPTTEQIRRIAYLGRLYGLKIPVLPVCEGHQSPAYMAAQLVYDRPMQSLWRGPRGGGKSLIAGFANYLLGQQYPDFEAKILGGSQAQSEQIYRAMDLFRKNRPEIDAIREMLKTEATFWHPDDRSLRGAHIQMLAASDKSVRGPHVPQLNLDEVDEIENAIREHAYGMAVAKGNLSASISMTSTWHKVSGPMAELFKEGEEGKFPVGTFCMFDVLERCPEERSGPDLEKCPACPLMEWCHADRDRHPQGLPKAKRSCGHYSIDAFIQKTFLSRRVFECDYLCYEPRAEGAWFIDFAENLHCTEDADYRGDMPFHCSIDPGVHTGAVWFQWRKTYDGHIDVNVFGDYYAEHLSAGASAHAMAIIDRTSELTGQPIQGSKVSMDPAGRQSNAVGPTVVGEYKRMGCYGVPTPTIYDWPYLGMGRPKTDNLQLVESLLKDATGRVGIKIHPRCKHLIAALKGYARAQSPSGQWLDRPVDPQHPHEETVDALSGGLSLEFPKGLVAPTELPKVHARRIV